MNMLILIGLCTISAFSMSVTAQSPASVTILVNENPPHASKNRETGKIEGVEVDIITSLMNAANVEYAMMIYPWNRAYRRAQEEKNTCLFPINYTPERKLLFAWIAPTRSGGGWAFYQRPDSNIIIKSFEDIKPYRIVGKTNIQPIVQIEEMTGKAVLRAPTDVSAAQLLFRRRADLMISGVHDSLVATRQARLPDPKMAYYWKSAQLGLACSKSTDPEIITRLRDANTERLGKLQ